MNLQARLLAFIAALVPLAPIAPAQDAPEVLSKVREACGLARFALHPDGIKLTGDVTRDAEQCRWECSFEPNWRFNEKTSGRLTTVTAFDGQTLWTRALGGEVLVNDFADRAMAITHLGIVTGLFLADGNGIAYKLAPERTTPDSVALQGDAEGGHVRFLVDVDRATWRPSSWRVVAGSYAVEYHLTGTLALDGLLFPAQVRLGSDVIRLSSAEALPPDASRFRFDASPPTDATFDAAATSVVPAKITRDGRLLVRPLLNGQDLGWFLFDTGSELTFVDPDALKAAGIEPFGTLTASGLGGQARASFARADTFTLGPLTIRDALLACTQVRQESFGEKVVGVAGFPVLARAVAEFDPQGASLRLRDSAGYDLPKGDWLPLRLSRCLPVLPGTCEGREALYRIDTGGVSVLFDEPTVRAWRLKQDRELHDVLIGGAGGVLALPTGKVRSLGLTGWLMKDVPAHFSADPTAHFRDTYTNASIGSELLRSFVLVMDYPGRRIAIVPRANWPGAPDK